MKKVLLLILVLINYTLLAQAPVAGFTASQRTICAGGTVNFIDTSTNAVSWNWSFGSQATPQNSTAQNPSVVYNTPGNYAVILSVSNSTGQQDVVFRNAYITVVSNATLTLSSAPLTDNQTICLGAPIDSIFYTVFAATGAAISGTLPTGLSTTFVSSPSGGVFKIFGTPTAPGTYTFDVVSNGGGCAGQRQTVNLTVEDAPTLILSSGSDNQQVCNGSPISPIEFTFGGGATGTTITPSLAGSGLSSSTSGNTTTITGTPTYQGPQTFTIETVGTGSCSSQSLDFTIEVNPTISLTSTAGTNNQTVCENTPIDDIVYTIGGGATGATTASPLPAGLTASFSGGTYTISGSPTTPGNYTIEVQTTGSPCPPLSEFISLTVEANHTLTLTSVAGSNSQTVCQNENITDITYVFGGGATDADVTGLPSGVTFLVSGTTVTISGFTATTGTFNYTVTTTGNTCVPATANGTITVTAGPDAALISAVGTDNQQICITNSITNIVYQTNATTATATVNGLPAGVSFNIVGNQITISGTPTVAGNFPYTIDLTGPPCPDVSLNGSIQVDELPTLVVNTPVTDTQDVCLNTPISLIQYTFGGSATAVLTSPLPSGLSSSTTGNDFEISGTPNVAGNYPITVFTDGGACEADTLYALLTVQNGPIVTLTSAVGTDMQTLCKDSIIIPIEYTMSGDATSLVATNLPPGVSPNLSGNVLTLSGAVTTPGSYTYSITASGGSCPDMILQGTIVVDEPAQLSLTSAVPTENQNICIGSAIVDITYETSGSATGAVSAGLPSGVTGSFSSGEFLISGTPTTPGLYNYSVTTTGGSCDADTVYGTIDVSDLNGLALSSAPGSDAQVICENENLGTLTYLISGGTTNVTLTGAPAGITGLLSGTTYTISGSSSVIALHNYTVTASGGSCPDVDLAGTIDIQEGPELTLSSASTTDTQTVCINTSIVDLEYTISGSATGASSTTLPTGVSGSFALGVYTISGTPSVAGTYDFKVFTTGGPCIGDTMYCQIIVDDLNGIALSSAPGSDAQVICENENLGTLTYLISGGTTNVTLTGAPAGIT
ncbi:MAG: PKD domain-containing protein, partial [Bacteroidetes bacterium]|nr:PKD domain-containing protein [Bacteroidota bacterium]